MYSSIYNMKQQVQCFDERNKNKHKGDLKVTKALIGTRPTLLDYIKGGLQIGLMVAIDFTGTPIHCTVYVCAPACCYVYY
jgi:hypothetical protein